MAIEIVSFPIKHGDFAIGMLVYQRVPMNLPYWENQWIYPLINVYITMERSTMLLMGKSTISMAMFNSELLVYRRVYE